MVPNSDGQANRGDGDSCPPPALQPTRSSSPSTGSTSAAGPPPADGDAVGQDFETQARNPVSSRLWSKKITARCSERQAPGRAWQAVGGRSATVMAEGRPRATMANLESGCDEM